MMLLRVETIVGVREVPGFQLVEWRHHFATRTEPEDATDVTISDHRSSSSVALALMKHAIANHVDRWFESEARYAEEQERMDELGDDYYG